MSGNRWAWWRALQAGLISRLLAVPVFIKVMGIALGLTLLLGGGMLWQIHRTWHDHLIRELEQRGQTFAERLAAQSAAGGPAGAEADLAEALRQMAGEMPELVLVQVRDAANRLVAEAPGPAAAPSGTSAMREVTNRAAGEAPRVRLVLSTARVDHEVNWLTRRLARITAGIAFLGMVATWGLTRILARPLQELVELTRAVQAGRFDVQVPVRARDEVGELAAAFNEMTAALAQKEKARRQLLGRVTRATEDERRRLARELHDHTGQSLTSLIAGLGALESQMLSPAIRDRLIELRQQAEQTLMEVHDLSVTLRPSVLDDVGLMAALDRHCRLFARNTGIEVRCEEMGLDAHRLDPELELTIYRVVQEALTNAVRHGQATRVGVLVQRTPRAVLVSVQDNGRGFDARDWQQRCLAGNHLGLLGIEERVNLLAGELCVESAPGKGTVVYAEIPLTTPTPSTA